jgi:hypothetical protein
MLDAWLFTVSSDSDSALAISRFAAAEIQASDPAADQARSPLVPTPQAVS